MQRGQIEELFYGKSNQQRRFTQDFPILPDVWIAYGGNPTEPQPLLLTPHNESDAPTLARALRARFGVGPDAGARQKRARQAGSSVGSQNVLFNESVVMAELTFHELLRDALPLTDWWKRIVRPIVLGGKWNEKTLRDIVTSDSTVGRRFGAMAASVDPRLLQKLVRIVGCIELARQGKPVPKDSLSEAKPTDIEITAFASVYARFDPVTPDAAGILWSISLNRAATTSVWRSRLTVKADAAARLFEAKTAGIRWAVLDTGIDARHNAFRRRDPKGKVLKPEADNVDDGISSRVVRTYDFMRIKDLLNSSTPPDTKGTVAALMPPAKLKILTDELQTNLENGRFDRLGSAGAVPSCAAQPQGVPRANARLSRHPRRRDPGGELAGSPGCVADQRADARRLSRFWSCTIFACSRTIPQRPRMSSRSSRRCSSSVT